MKWNTENPPKDGQPIVAVGLVISEGEFSTCVEPFTAAIFWKKTDSGFEGWCRFHDEYDLSLTNCLDDEVKIYFWAELPGQPERKPAGYLEPQISVDRGSKSIACFDGFEIVRPFQPYTDESSALQEAKEWFKSRTIHVPQVIYPMIRKMTVG